MQTVQHESGQIQQVLEGLNRLWNQRAMVHEGDPSVDIVFDPSKEDFKASLLPFASHPNWLAASDEFKQQVLSYGWIIYNEKTIQIESKLIAPVCDLIIDGKLPGSRNDAIQDTMSQALVDEAFHTLMAVKSVNIIYRERGLPRVSLPQFQLINRLEEMLSDCVNEEDKSLIRLAVACASETLITDYLGELAHDDQLQPLCYKTVAAHAADEWSHASVFSYTMAEIYSHLTPPQQMLYLNTLPLAVEAFGDDEIDVWEAVLSEIDFPGYQAMLEDCRRRNQQAISVDVKGIGKLLSSLGIEEEDFEQMIA